ncbi:MAG: Crp/Fnr family transcriptional regulator [Clostridia bacterium]|nr:Crp/Fnr family transcriptional regulator [Clostridia bacterium]
MTKSELALLQKCFLFEDDGENAILEFLKNDFCIIKTFSKGETIFGNDSSKEQLGIILSGKAAALCADSKNSSLKTFTSGELFGAASVFSPDSAKPFSLIRAASSAEVLFITKEGVEKLLFQKPEKAIRYIEFLSDRVSFLNRRIKTFTEKEALSRVAKFFLNAADQNGVCKKVNFSALAKSLDISRASLYRAKAELINLNAISADGRDIVILDREALKNT